MDGSAMYPRGFHPVNTSCLPDGRTMAWPRRRSAVPVRYYFVDYSLSTYFPPGTSPRLVIGEGGRDQEVPELSNDVPYDPFKADIYLVGNLFRRMFYKVAEILTTRCRILITSCRRDTRTSSSWCLCSYL